MSLYETISEAVFTPEEINIIKKSIKENFGLLAISPFTTEESLIFSTFGWPNYIFSGRVNEKVNEIIRGFLNTDRICELIGNHLGKPATMDSKYTVGFHVVYNPLDTVCTFSLQNFHRDILLGSPCDSYIVPIELGLEPQGLDIDNSGEIETIIYKENHMYMWSGMIPHTMRDITLHPKEFRITLQLHTKQDTDELVIFW